jgi:hypothetical protein
MVSSELRNWVNSLGKKNLSELHASFNSMSKVSALIKKEQLFTWKAGRDWAGM